jgi:eukaryotic-like serine/threonine-protein kinase
MSKPEPAPTSPSSDTLSWASTAPGAKVRDLTGATLGDFQVDRLLGRGGMGEVYLARQISLNREVAFKVLRPDLLTNPSYLTRFESEAWAAAKLNDPSIVHIYSLGSIDGIRFIAMEYVQGTNLREYLQKKGPPELLLALSIMRQAGNAIKAAGEVGLVHRDIKPENLLMTRKGVVKVADFGLCRDQDSDKHHVTQPGVTMGTPLYMSPEQAQGHALDHRSDLYSLGVTFYHMLAGQPPFRADSAIALALKHVKDIPVDLSVHRPDLPPDLCRLVMKLMEKAPVDRYQSASDLLRDIAKIRESVQSGSTLANISLPVATPSVSTPAGRPADLAPDVGSASQLSTGPGGSFFGSRVVPILIVVGLVVGGAVGWLLRPPDMLGLNARESSAPPALWMAPVWDEVPRQASAEQQYRYAQVQARSGSREAAWLAVPGYFPNAREWASRAYNQLARRLFRDRDAARLKVFAGELEKMGRAHESQLAVIAGVAASVINGDPQEVNDKFNEQGEFFKKLTDPALTELCLEITLEAERAARRERMTPSVLGSMRTIEARLINKTVNIMSRDIRGTEIH